MGSDPGTDRSVAKTSTDRSSKRRRLISSSSEEASDDAGGEQAPCSTSSLAPQPTATGQITPYVLSDSESGLLADESVSVQVTETSSRQDIVSTAPTDTRAFWLARLQGTDPPKTALLFSGRNYQAPGGSGGPTGATSTGPGLPKGLQTINCKRGDRSCS